MNDAITNERMKANMKQWELAKLMGISEFTLSRRMREELPEDEQKKIIDLIRNHAEKR